MKIIKGILNIVIGLFVGLLAYVAFVDYALGNKKDVEKYESL
jgi:hypothetical protein